jgi:hypothetical protein
MGSITAVTAANLLTENHLIAAALAEARVRRLIADRVSLRNSGFVEFVGDVANTGSKASRLRFAGLGASLAMTTAATETEEATPASIELAKADVTVGRHYLALTESQLAQIVTPDGDLDPDGLALTFAESWEGKFMDLLADTIDDFGTDIINSATDEFTLDVVYDIADEFEENDIDGPLCAAVAGKQISQLRNSSRAEGGALAMREDIKELQAMQGFQFEALNINFFRVNRVKNSGGSRHGAVWAPGAVGWNMGSTKKVKTSYGATKPAGLPLIVGYDFNEKAAKVDTVANAYFGEAIIYDDLGRGLVTTST